MVVCRQYMEVEPNSLSLEMAFVGRSKETLDSTDLDVNLGEAVHTFGSYLKYEVKPCKYSACSLYYYYYY